MTLLRKLRTIKTKNMTREERQAKAKIYAEKCCGVEDLCSMSRVKDCNHARMIYAYYLNRYHYITHTQIGRMIGGRNHATITHYLNRMKVAVETPQFDKELAEVWKDYCRIFVAQDIEQLLK